MVVPIEPLDDSIYEGFSPDLTAWLKACPANALLEFYKKDGFPQQSFRVGKIWKEEKDEFGRYPYARIRLRFDISPARMGMDFRTMDEIGYCECPEPEVSGVSIPHNPDFEFCNRCKKLYNYTELANKPITKPDENKS